MIASTEEMGMGSQHEISNRIEKEQKLREKWQKI